MLSMLPTWYLVSLVAIFGLLVGSFLNVVIYRVPAGESLMGRSHCPKCGHQIRSWDNIPVISWLLLGAKCRDCKAPISWRYPAVEAAHCAAWAGLALWHGFDGLLPLLLFFASMSIALALIDFDTLRLPNNLVFPTVAIVFVYQVALAALTGSWGNLKTALACALGFLVFLYLLHVLTKGRGLGFGDVKLSPALGMMSGWFGVGPALIGLFSSFLVGGVPAAILLLVGVLKRKQKIPFGPFLLLGTWIGIIWGQQLTDLYLSVTGLR
jgi:leader peptidase (prepilin peptidase) / N-methyltransferase